MVQTQWNNDSGRSRHTLLLLNLENRTANGVPIHIYASLSLDPCILCFTCRKYQQVKFEVSPTFKALAFTKSKYFASEQ